MLSAAISVSARALKPHGIWISGAPGSKRWVRALIPDDIGVSALYRFQATPLSPVALVILLFSLASRNHFNVEYLYQRRR
jgi:hypothetical protein